MIPTGEFRSFETREFSSFETREFRSFETRKFRSFEENNQMRWVSDTNKDFINVRYSKRLNFRDDCTEFILSVSLISWFPATFSRLVFWQLIYKVV